MKTLKEMVLSVEVVYCLPCWWYWRAFLLLLLTRNWREKKMANNSMSQFNSRDGGYQVDCVRSIQIGTRIKECNYFKREPNFYHRSGPGRSNSVWVFLNDKYFVIHLFRLSRTVLWSQLMKERSDAPLSAQRDKFRPQFLPDVITSVDSSITRVAKCTTLRIIPVW